jgi:hypothetical protein
MSLDVPGVPIDARPPRSRSAASGTVPAPLIAAGAAVLVAYVTTMARTVTKWDSGEFIAAAHSLGIPHPPGTPLYVLLSRVWGMLPLPISYAMRINLFSAFCAAAAVTLLGILVSRWTRDRLAGLATVLCAGGTGSLWLSATESEAYAPALLFAVVLMWVADSARDGDSRKLALLAFLAALGWTLHPAALVLLPGAAMLVLDRGTVQFELTHTHSAARKARPWLLFAALVLGFSSLLYLCIRAQHDPAINQGNPATLPALWDVLTRAQYPDPGFWPRQAPLWLQFGNWFEYADWQFALGLAPSPPPSWLRTPVTTLFAGLGIAGFFAHRRLDRRSWRALAVAFAAATVGLVLYLNFKAGPSYGFGILTVDVPREARERDYFFIGSFVIWGAWAAIGAVALARRASRHAQQLDVAGAGAAVLLCAAPLFLNWPLAWRERAVASRDARSAAVAMLGPLPDSAVFLAFGDNDTYPLWYLQQVEGVRRDVAVVTVPMLGIPWYRAEVARRHALLDPAHTSGRTSALREVYTRAAARSRPVVLSPFARR